MAKKQRPAPEVVVEAIETIGEGKYPPDSADAKIWLRLMRTRYTINGKTRFWWHTSRNGLPGVKSDAVVIVTLVRPQKNSRKFKLLVIDEARLPLAEGLGPLSAASREYGFPAGLIEEGDEALEDRVAAELHEETGLEIVKIHKELTSQCNLISSAGLSNESVTMVFIEAAGKISNRNLTEFEDINARLLDFDEVMELMETPGINISAKAWSVMFGWKLVGKLTFDLPKKRTIKKPAPEEGVIEGVDFDIPNLLDGDAQVLV